MRAGSLTLPACYAFAGFQERSRRIWRDIQRASSCCSAIWRLWRGQGRRRRTTPCAPAARASACCSIYHQQITEGSLINSITAGIDVIRHFHVAYAAEASEYINHPVEGPANIFHRSFTAEHLAVSWAATYICRMDTKTEASAIPRCSISTAGWAAEIYRAMSSEKKYEKGMYGPINVIKLVSDNADKLRGLLILASKCCFRAALMDYTVCINGIRRYKRWACLAKRSWASG